MQNFDKIAEKDTLLKAMDIRMLVRGEVISGKFVYYSPDSPEAKDTATGELKVVKLFPTNAPLKDLFNDKIARHIAPDKLELELLETIPTYHDFDEQKIGSAMYAGYYDTTISAILKQIPLRVNEKKVFGFEIVDSSDLENCEKITYSPVSHKNLFTLSTRLYSLKSGAKVPHRIKNQPVLYGNSIVTRNNIDEILSDAGKDFDAHNEN